MTLYTIADITPGGAATQVTPTQTAARFFIVSAPSGNSSDIRVGDSNVGSSRGHVIAKGTSKEFPMDGADPTQLYQLNQIYVFASGSDKASIAYGY